MNLSAIAIRRPVFTTMLMGAVLVLGAMGFGRLGTDLFPDVTFFHNPNSPCPSIPSPAT